MLDWFEITEPFVAGGRKSCCEKVSLGRRVGVFADVDVGGLLADRIRLSGTQLGSKTPRA